MTHIIGTIEARMGSSRLPGKTMSSIYNGMPLLEFVVRRFRTCHTLANVVVATTVEPGDDIIAEWCIKIGGLRDGG
jgi:spore coat polysaccharide biosynthesis protein SpsF